MYRTEQSLAVLCALDTEQWRYISQISQRLLADYVQVHRALRRFEKAGWAESMTEEIEEADHFERNVYFSKRAPRRFYRLTAEGVSARDGWLARP